MSSTQASFKTLFNTIDLTGTTSFNTVGGDDLSHHFTQHSDEEYLNLLDNRYSSDSDSGYVDFTELELEMALEDQQYMTNADLIYAHPTDYSTCPDKRYIILYDIERDPFARRIATPIADIIATFAAPLFITLGVVSLLFVVASVHLAALGMAAVGMLWFAWEFGKKWAQDRKDSKVDMWDEEKGGLVEDESMERVEDDDESGLYYKD